MKSLEQQWNEYFFFGGPMPRMDSVTVPYPTGFRPIPIKYIPSVQKVVVKVK